MASVYPMLLAAWAVWNELQVASLRPRGAHVIRRTTWMSLAIRAPLRSHAVRGRYRTDLKQLTFMHAAQEIVPNNWQGDKQIWPGLNLAHQPRVSW
jgi:hypothetical protein